MPVSMCEWRVRIGTFIHWIRDYEVRERKERLLKERIRRLKVLYERLKGKKDESEEQPQDGSEPADGNKQLPGHACPHKRASIQSSDNSANIKDLLTSCDLCTKELLTPTDSNHIKNLLNPPDASNNILPPPTDSSIKDLLSLHDFCKTHSTTSCDINIKDHTNNLSHVQKLLRASDSGIRDLLIPSNSMEVELLLQNDDFPNDKEIQSDAKTQVRATDFFDTSIIISDNDRGLQTPSDLLIEDLLAPRDSLISTLISSGDSCTSELLSHGDAFLFKLLSPGDSFISELLSSGDYHHLPERFQRKGTPRPTEDISLTLNNNHCLPEMLLVQAGDVELNPGPQDSVLQESELGQLAEDIPGSSYTKLCDALGFGYEYSNKVRTKHLLDINAALMEILCSWKVRQRDKFICRKVLAGILGKIGLGALETKLLADPVQETLTPVLDMTENQVHQCGEDFKTFYRERLFKIQTDPLDFKAILELDRIYTNLILLSKGTSLDYSVLFNTTRTAEGNEVFPNRILVEGEGGVGKTTFCSKIAWDWVDGSPVFQQYKWVLVVPLRKVHKGQTFGDIVKRYLSDNNTVTPEQINKYIQSQPSKVLIILDGLDEYDSNLSAEDASDVSKILRLDQFKDCRVLVTTRPWKAELIKFNKDLCSAYEFLALKGFNKDNVSTYIKKYFVEDEELGSELIQFIATNDVIKDNMAPFPIYVAMLCTMWKDSNLEMREKIRRLKTFSQFFNQMTTFLKDHYVVKLVNNLNEEFSTAMSDVNKAILEIGQTAFSGLLVKQLIFKESDFNKCISAMRTCCRIGILSQDKHTISRWERSSTTSHSVSSSVFFPHKLFQEYVAALHIASLYDAEREQYYTSINKVMMGKNLEEFRFLLYFIVAQGKDVGLDIIKKIPQLEEANDSSTYHFMAIGNQRSGRNIDFLVDVTFEAYDKDTGKTVGQRIFLDEQQLTIDEDTSAHTLSGYLFIMEQHSMKSLTLKDRSCGATVSHDLAHILSSSGLLSRIEFQRTTLDGEFYRLMKTKGSTTVLKDESNFSVKELYVDHRFIADLQRFDVTVGDLFPSLEHLVVSTLQTVSSSVIKQLKHLSLEVLSIQGDYDPYWVFEEDEDYPVPLTGDPATLGQLFSNSFPKLTSLTFKDLIVGNIRCKAILQTLRKHQHFRDIRITRCFTDDELDPLAHEIASESEVEVNLEHNPTQVHHSHQLLTSDLMDALCHRTCIRQLILEDFDNVDADWFPDLCGREVDSKIEKLDCHLIRHHDQSQSRCLGKFVSLLPFLTDLAIDPGTFHEAFYEEILNRFSSSKIQTLTIISKTYGFKPVAPDPSVCSLLGSFLCLLPCLTDLTIDIDITLHDRFYEEVSAGASSSKIEKIVCHLDLSGNQSASRCLGKFISLLPCLTDLTIDSGAFCEAFYEEILNRFSSSKIQTLTMSKNMHVDGDPSACGMLGRLLCLLPCLTDLTIDTGITFYDQFYEEVSAGASSSKIEKLECYLDLRDNQSASRCLGKFISLLPCLTDLTIDPGAFREAFYEEILNRSSSSKIQTLKMSRSPSGYMHVDRDPTACGMLGRLLCLLPCLTDLTIDTGITLHDQFYKEIAAGAASSKIEKIVCHLDLSGNQSASRCLGKFISLLPCLTDLTIDPGALREAFCEEILNRSSSSKIQTLTMSTNHFGYMHVDRDQSLWGMLGRFLCLLPCLTDLLVDADMIFHDQFYEEISAGASSSKNPYFRNNKHVVLLHEWTERKNQERRYLQQYQQHQQKLQQQQQLRQQQLFALQVRQQQQEQLRINNRQYTNAYCRDTLEQSYPSLLEIHQQRDNQVSIHDEPDYVHPFQGLMQDCPGSSWHSVPEPDPSTKKHLDEFDNYLQTYLSYQNNTITNSSHHPQHTAYDLLQEAKQHTGQHSLYPVPHGLGEPKHVAMVQGSGPTDQLQNEHSSLASSSEYINSCTSFYQERHSGIGRKPMYENSDDLPSTSGWNRALGQGSSGLEGQTQNERTSLASSSSSDDDIPSTSGCKTTESGTESGLIESERAAKLIHSESDKIEDSTEKVQNRSYVKKRIHSDSEDSTDESKRRSHGKRRAKTDREPTSP